MKCLARFAVPFVITVLPLPVLAQCSGGCPPGAITTLPSGGTITIPAGVTYCISGALDNSSTNYVIDGTLIIQSGVVSIGSVTLNKTGRIYVKFAARLNTSGTFTGSNVPPTSTIDNLVVCNGGYLNINGSFGQERINIVLNDFSVLLVNGAWTASVTDTYANIGAGALVELCASLNINKNGFFTETSSSESYLVTNGSVSNSTVNGFLSTSTNSSEINWTSKSPSAFVSHPAAHTCNACGNFNLAPPGTDATCGSAANNHIDVILPVTIKSFYESYTNNQLNITAELDNATSVQQVALEQSVNGRQYTLSPYKAISATAGTTQQYTFHITAQESNRYYRLRVVTGQNMIYSWALHPVTRPANDNLKIYPNPAGHFIYLQLPNHHQYQLLTLLNNTGQFIRQQSIAMLSGTMRYELPAELSPGVYFIRLSGNNATPLTRMLKKM